MGGVPNAIPKGKRPMQVQESQPPLPRTTLVRLVAQEDNKEQERALVLVMLEKGKLGPRPSQRSRTLM